MRYEAKFVPYNPIPTLALPLNGRESHRHSIAFPRVRGGVEKNTETDLDTTVQTLTQACEAALDLTHFVPRTVVAALGAGSSRDEQLRWLGERSATAWTQTRMREALAQWLGSSRSEDADTHIDQLTRALRLLRRDVVLGTLVRDVAGVAPLEKVTTAMTVLAEVAVQEAVAAHAARLQARHGVPVNAQGEPVDLLVIAMGKGGGAELNVSSDLDLVFVYDDDGDTQLQPTSTHKSLSNHEFFERLGRGVIGLLSEVTAEGFVFRIDMRLRPHGDSGPLVVSNAMLEEYLVRDGRTWERFAWLKGRVISAPVFSDVPRFTQQVLALEGIVRPFVFRKYLDFNAIAALRELHAQVRAETERKAAGKEARRFNVKLGRGGIREIEFIAQTFQVMRGGREARLAAVARSTRGTLAQLPQMGALPEDVCARLDQSYEFLRRFEHALQYMDDAQTHAIPADAADRERVAQLLRMQGAASLMAHYTEVTEFVATSFDGIFSTRSNSSASSEEKEMFSEESFAALLRTLAFAAPEQTATRVANTLAGRRVASCPEGSRRLIETLLIQAARRIAAAPQEQTQAADFTRAGLSFDDILTRFVRLMDAIAGRSTYLALLAQYPQAFARVLRLLEASDWATDYLLRHPILLDELINESAFEGQDDLTQWARWAQELRAQLQASDDVEAQMNLLRDAHHAQTFRLLLADLTGQLSVERLADHLSALADQTLNLAVQGAWRAVPRRHRDAPAYAVIAYGKYGGKELGYASDLDIVLLYDDPAPEAPEVYGMLTRRLVNWLTAHTSSGTLFDIDLRLRPDGDKGLLFSSFDAFANYQRNADPSGKGQGAWTWEHQALTRARYCAGDAALGQRFEALRAEILSRTRDASLLAADVRRMRERMHAGHPNDSGLFDLKHDAGGMVDVEFIVQYLVLAYAHDHSRLVGNLGNIALLVIAGALGLIEPARAQAVADAYRDYRRVQHRLRMNNAQYARVPKTERALERAAVQALWQEVLQAVPGVGGG